MIKCTVVFILCVLFLAGLSIRERMRLRMFREMSLEDKDSPLSQAIMNLLGFAGGIYLSLVMFFDFLKIKLPDFIHLGQIQLEPLAAFSISLAVLQPFVIRLFILRRKW